MGVQLLKPIETLVVAQINSEPNCRIKLPSNQVKESSPVNRKTSILASMCVCVCEWRGYVHKSYVDNGCHTYLGLMVPRELLGFYIWKPFYSDLIAPDRYV